MGDVSVWKVIRVMRVLCIYKNELQKWNFGFSNSTVTFSPHPEDEIPIYYD